MDGGWAGPALYSALHGFLSSLSSFLNVIEQLGASTQAIHQLRVRVKNGILSKTCGSMTVLIWSVVKCQELVVSGATISSICLVVFHEVFCSLHLLLDKTPSQQFISISLVPEANTRP